MNNVAKTRGGLIMSTGMLGKVVQKLTQLPEEMLGTLFDLLEKLTGKQGQMWLRDLKKMLRRENLTMTFKVTTNGRSREQLIGNLRMRGILSAKGLLRNKQFVATNGVTYMLVVIMGEEFDDSMRTIGNIRGLADIRGYLESPMELAPYLLEIFSDEDFEQMGIRELIVMHTLAIDLDDSPCLLGVCRRDNDSLELNIFDGSPNDKYPREAGFVFRTFGSD